MTEVGPWHIFTENNSSTRAAYTPGKVAFAHKISVPDVGKGWLVQLNLLQVSTLPIVVLSDGAGQPAATEYRERITIYNIYFFL